MKLDNKLRLDNPKDLSHWDVPVIIFGSLILSMILVTNSFMGIGGILIMIGFIMICPFARYCVLNNLWRFKKEK